MDYITIPWELIEFGLPHRRPGGEWIAKSGIRIQRSSNHDPPFGRSRIILCYFAVRARSAGCIFDGSFADLNERLGLDWRPANLEHHFLSVTECTYSAITPGQCCDSACPAYRWLDVVRLHHYCPERHTFRVELSEAFVSRLQHSARCPLDKLQAFMNLRGMAPLDLYAWYIWMLHRGQYGPMDAFGPDGPYSLLVGASHDRKRPQALQDTHAEVVRIWPDCPFRLIEHTVIVHESVLNTTAAMSTGGRGVALG